MTQRFCLLPKTCVGRRPANEKRKNIIDGVGSARRDRIRRSNVALSQSGKSAPSTRKQRCGSEEPECHRHTGQVGRREADNQGRRSTDRKTVFIVHCTRRQKGDGTKTGDDREVDNQHWTFKPIPRPCLSSILRRQNPRRTSNRGMRLFVSSVPADGDHPALTVVRAGSQSAYRG